MTVFPQKIPKSILRISIGANRSTLQWIGISLNKNSQIPHIQLMMCQSVAAIAVVFVMISELTQRTLCSCKPPARASYQQNCLSSGDLRRKRSHRKRQMRDRMICTQQRGTFFKRICEASHAAHPHSTGRPLP